MNNKAAEFKKRLMFLKGEDLYYLAYNTIVLLHGLSCESQQYPFCDYSKIAFLIDFVADSRLISIVGPSKQKNTHIGPIDRQLLQSTYTEGLVRRHIMSRLIFALEKKSIVTLEMKQEKGIVTVWLEMEGIPPDYFNTELYDTELENIKSIKKALPQIRTMTLDTMLQ
ncbi:hypothetical protein KA005_38655, partial [bacterium]|nr:hypothetical protein [bacterium]